MLINVMPFLCNECHCKVVDVHECGACSMLCRCVPFRVSGYVQKHLYAHKFNYDFKRRVKQYYLCKIMSGFTGLGGAGGGLVFLLGRCSHCHCRCSPRSANGAWGRLSDRLACCACLNSPPLCGRRGAAPPDGAELLLTTFRAEC